MVDHTDTHMDFSLYWRISNVQGQEVVAEKALEIASKEGHWVILQVSVYKFKAQVTSATLQ